VTAPEVRTARPGEVEALLLLREEVFCAEQGVPVAEERDALDATALHLVAVGPAGDVVGTCRLVAREGGEWSLGRMAVRREWRGRGVGRLLVREAERQARAGGARTVALGAQMHAVRFYSGLGYRSRGGVYPDAGIPHVRMARPLD
jgi:putative N-acetyltransferase (TIGR04045 family)